MSYPLPPSCVIYAYVLRVERLVGGRGGRGKGRRVVPGGAWSMIVPFFCCTGRWVDDGIGNEVQRSFVCGESE